MLYNIRVYLVLALTGSLLGTALYASAQPGGMSKYASPSASTAQRAGSRFAGKGMLKIRVTFNPAKKRDPMLSPDDILLLEHREKQRLAAIEAERKRKEEEERKRRAEEERKRQWELLLLKDPSIVVRDKIKIDGIIDKEVMIGGKLYGIGNTYLGAKIIGVGEDSVTFLYKGHRFVKKARL